MCIIVFDALSLWQWQYLQSWHPGHKTRRFGFNIPVCKSSIPDFLICWTIWVNQIIWCVCRATALLYHGTIKGMTVSMIKHISCIMMNVLMILGRNERLVMPMIERWIFLRQSHRESSLITHLSFHIPLKYSPFHVLPSIFFLHLSFHQCPPDIFSSPSSFISF